MNSDLSLTNSDILVWLSCLSTSGDSVVAQALATDLLKVGWHVILIARGQQALEKVQTSCFIDCVYQHFILCTEHVQTKGMCNTRFPAESCTIILWFPAE